GRFVAGPRRNERRGHERQDHHRLRHGRLSALQSHTTHLRTHDLPIWVLGEESTSWEVESTGDYSRSLKVPLFLRHQSLADRRSLNSSLVIFLSALSTAGVTSRFRLSCSSCMLAPTPRPAPRPPRPVSFLPDFVSSLIASSSFQRFSSGSIASLLRSFAQLSPASLAAATY